MNNYFSFKFMILLSGMLIACSGCNIINGAARLENKTFTEHLTVNGALDGSNLRFQSLSVNGAVNLENTWINGDLQVNGSLRLKNSQIGENVKVKVNGFVDLSDTTSASDMEINGKLVLKDAKTMNISITHIKNPLHVKIEGHTVIDGELRFPFNNGLVSLSPETTITKGIVGGKFEKTESLERTDPIIKGKEHKQ